MATLDVLDLAGRIGEAPLDPAGWPQLLADIAAASGGWGGELITGSDGRFRMYLAGNIPTDLIEEFARRGGADPRVNPRAAAVFTTMPMRVVCDPDYISDASRARHPMYAEFLDRVDAPYASVAVLAVDGRARTLLSVTRSARQGLPSAEQLALVAALLPSLQAAARLQMRLEAGGAEMALGALDRLGAAAILCDAAGRIVRVSGPAEALLAEGAVLTQRLSVLRALSPQSDRDLQLAIEREAAWNGGLAARGSVVLLQGSEPGATCVADVIRLPSSSGAWAMGARVLVVVGGPRSRRPNDLLMNLGLTFAEASVARLIGEGLSPAEVALQRGVGVETVRAQIKAVYGKLGVNRQAALAAALRRLA